MTTFITYLLTPVFVRQLVQYLPKQTPQFELEPCGGCVNSRFLVQFGFSVDFCLPGVSPAPALQSDTTVRAGNSYCSQETDTLDARAGVMREKRKQRLHSIYCGAYERARLLLNASIDLRDSRSPLCSRSDDFPPPLRSHALFTRSCMYTRPKMKKYSTRNCL